MTYKELKDQLDKEETLYEKKREEFKEFEEAHDRIVNDIHARMIVANEEFEKSVRKHFAGVEVNISHSAYDIFISIFNDNVLDYNESHIASKLSEDITNKIIDKYKKHYGKE